MATGGVGAWGDSVDRLMGICGVWDVRWVVRPVASLPPKRSRPLAESGFAVARHRAPYGFVVDMECGD